MNKNLQKMSVELVKREGKKSNIKAGDAKEALGIVADLLFENPEMIGELIAWARKRAERKR